jgi:hypothetical protein
MLTTDLPLDVAAAHQAADAAWSGALGSSTAGAPAVDRGSVDAVGSAVHR